MPCYDPPPPWEGRQKRNAEEAVRLLCKQAGEAIAAGQTPTREILEWFLAHREIDLEIALGSNIIGAVEHNRIKYQEAEAARRDIEIIRRMLIEQQ